MVGDEILATDSRDIPTHAWQPQASRGVNRHDLDPLDLFVIPVLNFPGGDLGQGGKAKILPKSQ